MNISKVSGLEELYEHWFKDSKIDDIKLHRESTRTPNIHAKYCAIRSHHNMVGKSIGAEIARTKKWKTEYYTGKLPKDELRERNLEAYHNHALKNEVQPLLDADEELLKLSAKKFHHDEIVSFCNDVLKMLSHRTYAIGNAIKWEMTLMGK